MAVVLYVSLPLILLNAFSYFADIIDTAIVANTDDNTLSSVVMIGQLKNLFTALGSGLATGGSIMVARLIGRGDFVNAKVVANTVLTMALIVAVFLVAVLLPFSRVILRLAGLTDELIALGIDYFCVEIVTVGVSIFNTVFLGLEKARGATVNILVVNIIMMATKIVLSLLFVPVLQLDSTMVAVATLISNLCITVYAVIKLVTKDYLFKYSLGKVQFTKQYLLPLVRLFFPVFLGKFVFFMGKVIVNSLAVGYGDEAPGALGVSNQISGSIVNMTSSTEDASSSITSQNLGDKRYERIIQTFWCTLIINVVVDIIGVVLLTVFGNTLAEFFSGGNAYKKELIIEIFDYEKLGILALGINSAVSGLIYGLGYTKLSMVCNLSRLFAFRIPSILIMINFFPQLGAESLGIAMLISNWGIGLMSIVIAIVCLNIVKNNKAKDDVRI